MLSSRRRARAAPRGGEHDHRLPRSRQRARGAVGLQGEPPVASRLARPRQGRRRRRRDPPRGRDPALPRLGTEPHGLHRRARNRRAAGLAAPLPAHAFREAGAARAVVPRGMQQHDPPGDPALSRPLRRRRRAAAALRRAARHGDRGARALRVRARLQGVPPQPRSLREHRSPPPGLGRPVLVSPLREAVRARRPRPCPRHRLAVGARALLAPLHQRGDDSRLRAGELPGARRLSRPQDRRQPRRRRDPLPARALRVRQPPPRGRRALQPPHAAALLRHGPLHARGGGAPDQGRRGRPVPVRRRVPGRRLVGGPRHGTPHGRRRPPRPGDRLAVRLRPGAILGGNAKRVFKLDA